MCLNLAAEDADIDEAYLHVQTSNTDAINFYKRFGFEVKDKILNYYKRIDPPGGYMFVFTSLSDDFCSRLLCSFQTIHKTVTIINEGLCNLTCSKVCADLPLPGT